MEMINGETLTAINNCVINTLPRYTLAFLNQLFNERHSALPLKKGL